MPINYNDYPSNWKSQIRPYILARAKNRCEFCKVKNYASGVRGIDGKLYSWEYIEEKLERHGIDLFDDVLANGLNKDGTAKVIKIVLTVAHIDHDITNNNYRNLKALCQRCHLHHDKFQHKQTRQKGKKQLELF
jgi:hypothetical protein